MSVVLIVFFCILLVSFVTGLIITVNDKETKKIVIDKAEGIPVDNFGNDSVTVKTKNKKTPVKKETETVVDDLDELPLDDIEELSFDKTEVLSFDKTEVLSLDKTVRLFFEHMLEDDGDSDWTEDPVIVDVLETEKKDKKEKKSEKKDEII